MNIAYYILFILDNETGLGGRSFFIGRMDLRCDVADFQSLQQLRALQQHAARRSVDVVVLFGQVHQRRYGCAARVQQARAL